MDLNQRLSPHFTLGELVFSQTAARKGMDNTPSEVVVANLVRLAATLEAVREAVNGRPVVVSSGFRSFLVNKMVGGADQSAHIFGLAADIHVPGMTIPELAQAIITAGVEFQQLIQEGTWCHIAVPATGRAKGEVLTAIFTPGRPTRYIAGLA
jgi:hypothetical protein